jgi:Glycosyl transferase family 2
VSEPPPADVERLLEQRAAARAQRDWAAADELRDRIRALGWEPIDAPGGSTVRPALPPGDAAGASYVPDEEVASLLDEPASLEASLVTIVDDHPEDLARLAAALIEHTPACTWELVVVANAPSTDLPDDLLSQVPATILRTAARLGWADVANLGLRRSRGAVIILLDGSVEPTGDITGPLLAAFDDPGVGLAGPWGVSSPDARHFADAGPGEVDAVLGYCLAARRGALAAVRGFDPRFRYYRNADLDLSFDVRDRGWRALAVADLPLERHEHRGWTALPEDERDRLSRRNFYRFLDRWGRRADLLIGHNGQG